MGYQHKGYNPKISSSPQSSLLAHISPCLSAGKLLPPPHCPAEILNFRGIPAQRLKSQCFAPQPGTAPPQNQFQPSVSSAPTSSLCKNPEFPPNTSTTVKIPMFHPKTRHSPPKFSSSSQHPHIPHPPSPNHSMILLHHQHTSPRHLIATGIPAEFLATSDQSRTGKFIYKVVYGN